MPNFIESEWLRLLFHLADTHTWLEEMTEGLLDLLPVTQKKKYRRKTWHLSAAALAHIAERHYYKVPRHPGTGKFHISIPEIVEYIRDASAIEPRPVPGTLLQKRIIQTGKPIGFSKDGQPATIITILSDAAGNIITAYPDNITGDDACSSTSLTTTLPSFPNPTPP